jgi:mitochondrial ATPase complex subunit ATP10
MIISFQRALYFPNIEGMRLSDKENVHTTNILAGKVSIVSIISTQMSEVSEILIRIDIET